MTTIADQPTITRIDPLPVRMDAGTGQILLYVGDRKVASAWGPAADDPDAWFLWNGRTEPYRISGGRDGALAILNDTYVDWWHREGSLWHPGHGPVDEHGCVAKAPAGVMCVGCGVDLAAEAPVSIVVYPSDSETTQHYVCDNCAPYYEHDDEERPDDHH